MPDHEPNPTEHPLQDEHGHDHSATPCEEALQELYVYLDGELTEEKRGAIRGHLDDCNPCFEAFDFEAELRIVISTRCREEVPESLRDRIAQQLHTTDD
ncbi:MAG TPA: mycothiol system anti-sigma-R factor [Acidimicrobiales bacterium]